MFSDYNAMLAAALARILRDNERRKQLALGRPQSTTNRSVAQLWGKRWGHKRLQSNPKGGM